MLMTWLFFVNKKGEVWKALFHSLMIIEGPREKLSTNKNLVSTLASILMQIRDRKLECLWGLMKVSCLLPTRVQLSFELHQSHFISRRFLIEYVIDLQVGKVSVY